MQPARTLVFIALAVGIAVPAQSQESPKDPAAENAMPPVLRKLEADSNVIVHLPGPAQLPPAAEAGPASGANGTSATNAAASASSYTAINPDDPPRPLLKHIYPPSFDQDSALFCQKLIGQWTADDARFLLGEPIRQRAAYDSNNQENGQIYAFSDPTGHYRELELDFSKEDGTLRTVFVYPFHLTWMDCRRMWGASVNATDAAKGRRFYSYLNRRMDVLVDPEGKVISFGLY